MEDKKMLLRKFIATEKKKYDAVAREALSRQILALLEKDASFVGAHTVLMYYSLGDEVQTHDFVDRWSKSKRILLPVVEGDDLELRVYEGRDELKEGAFHIDEPTGAIFTHYDDIDLVIVPGVAFDKEGNRLGRGKGYYDRLLPRIKARKIGICFPFQKVDKVPVEPYDIKMNAIITI